MEFLADVTVDEAVGFHTEALTELRAAVVGLVGDLDHRVADGQLGPRRKIGFGEVHVDDELITGQRHTLRRRPEAAAPGVALVDAGVVGVLERCRANWCEVTADSFTGWLEREAFYGLYPGEEVE